MNKIFTMLGWITAILSALVGAVLSVVPFVALVFVDVKMAKNVLFLILSKTLGGALSLLGFIYAIISRISSKDKLNEYIYRCALSKDQTANVFAGDLLDSTCSMQAGAFGDPDLTVSESIGFLLLDDKLSKTGNFLNRLLNLFEANHALKSIQKDGEKA